MKKYQFLLLTTSIACILQGCARTGNDFWEDTKSAGRHMGRGVRAMGGKHGDSRQIRSRGDFECIDDGAYCEAGGVQDCNYQEYNYQDLNYQEYQYHTQDCNTQASDYIPLQNAECDDIAMADVVAPQPRETPGEPGSSIPGINYFRDPNTLPNMAGVFRTIYFDYDSSLIRGPQNLQAVHNIAEFLKRNPQVYVFIEGHTDERGPQAYNLALGSRRSNAVRNMLISEGIHPDRLFTVSYGKERPVILEHHEEGWAKNRRAEFKVYER